MGLSVTPGWCVRVTVFDDLVVSISERELCGRDLSAADQDLIRGCARHLLSFVGEGDNGLSEQPEDKRGGLEDMGDGKSDPAR